MTAGGRKATNPQPLGRGRASNSDFFARIRTVTIERFAKSAAPRRVNGSRKTSLDLRPAALSARRSGRVREQFDADDLDHDHALARAGVEFDYAESGNGEWRENGDGNGVAERGGTRRRCHAVAFLIQRLGRASHHTDRERARIYVENRGGRHDCDFQDPDAAGRIEPNGPDLGGEWDGDGER